MFSALTQFNWIKAAVRIPSPLLLGLRLNLASGQSFRDTSIATVFFECFFITIIYPLHVTALTVHLQIEYIYWLLPKELPFFTYGDDKSLRNFNGHRVTYKELTSITGPKLFIGTQQSRYLSFSPEDGNRSSFRNVVFSCIYNSRRWTKPTNPVILNVIHHRQNP
jgi:hypothetical protein